jgi:hypothetical protein
VLVGVGPVGYSHGNITQGQGLIASIVAATAPADLRVQLMDFSIWSADYLYCWFGVGLLGSEVYILCG